MPYSPPGVVVSPLPTPPAGPPHHHHQHAPRPSHRRSYTFAPDDPRAGPGAFASLGMLPRRTQSHAPSSPRKFHFRNDDDSSSSSDEPPVPAHAHDDDDGPPPPLRLRQPPAPAFRLTPATGAHRSSPPRSPQRSPNSSYTNVPAALSPSALNVPVPFPRSLKNSNSPSSPMSPNFPPRPPGPARTASHPVIFLSNGKPLKSSLKSSSSAPHVWSPGSNNNEGKPSFHLRAASAPSTPQLAGVEPSSAGSAWDQGSDPLSPGTPKAVHFPAPDAGLEDIRLFKRSARPASVSFPLDDETETETETDSQQPRISVWGTQSPAPRQEGGFPFPKVPSPVGKGSLLNPERQQRGAEGKEWRYALDAPGVPRAVDAERDGASMVLLEGMWLAGAGADPSSSTSIAGAGQVPEREGELTLHGTLLARNAAFEKQLYVRFTLDGWCTTSEVGGRYVGPAESPFARGGEDEPEERPGPGWDRFAFSIRLTDYAHSAPAGRQHTQQHAQGLRERGVGGVGRGLEGRELVLVARFFAPWVRAGGVAPYAWCDTLPQHTPAQQVGTDVSASGRAWVGAGAGGAGEWWDNNGGRDYRVGFRCVGVEPTPAAPAPAPVAAAPTNIIPFPRSASPALAPPPSSTLAPPPSSASPAPSEAKPTTTIPPPPPPRTAHAQALAAKLGRLSLRNYAAPGGGAGRAVSLPGTATAQVPAAVANEKETQESAKDEKKQEETDTKEEKEKEKEKEKVQPAPGTQSAGGVGLYWPWGRAAVAAPPAPASPVAALAPAPSGAAHTNAHDDDSGSSSSDDEEEELRDAEAGRARRASGFSSQGDGEETPPTSPLGAGGLLPALEEMGLSESEDKEEKKASPEDVPLPESPERVMSPSPTRRSASPPMTTTTTTQAQTPTPPVSPTTPLTPSAADASSSLYKAFVRQWCFAGNGSGAGGGVSPPLGAGAKGVLGGLV